MATQVFATALDTYFQLTVMLMILVVGSTLLQHFQPFESQRSQIIQVSPVLNEICHLLMRSGQHCLRRAILR